MPNKSIVVKNLYKEFEINVLDYKSFKKDLINFFGLDKFFKIYSQTQNKISALQNVNFEIIDLRTLVPWDKNLVLSSVEKTGKVIILHEATQTAGFGAEIAATLAEEGFEYLDAPIVRIASLDTPTPFSPQIETQVFWPKNKINQKIKKLLEY